MAPKYSSPAQEQYSEKPKTLNLWDSIELVQTTVDTARESIQQIAGGTGDIAESLKPKLTADLAGKHLDKFPLELIEIIQIDVERLILSHNALRSVPNEFSRCQALRYLNLRDNQLGKIPEGVLSLTQLEILDVSKNQLHHVPPEIEKMKALRVFSIQYNNIVDLPLCLGGISALRMLKVAGNPLNPKLKRILEHGEKALSPPMSVVKNDNDRDTFLTKKVTEFLRHEAVAGEESSEGPAETPRASSSRFQMHTNSYGHYTSGSESASDLRTPTLFKSPMSPRSPRNHYRNASNQNNSLQSAALRRPGLAPLALGNERSRSNSESILQASQNHRNKRMGIVTKKTNDLNLLEENRNNRNSYHLRGQSHGSALKNGIRAGEDSSSDATSQKSSQQGTFVRRLSSVPEIRQDKSINDNIIEGAKSILYSLHLVHPYLSNLITLVKEGKSKRSSFERIHHQASLHIDHLDHSLHGFNNAPKQGRNSRMQSKKVVCQATVACISIYQQVGTILLQNVEQLVRDGDERYIRSLMLMLYGSLNEARNARRSLAPEIEKRKSQQKSIDSIPPIKRVVNAESPIIRDRSQPQIRERPKPERRWRNGSIVQQSANHTNIVSSLGAQTPATSYSSAPSRSTSRAGTVRSSAASSVVSTPMSGESFGSALLVPRSRSGSTSLNAQRIQEAQLESQQFEQIYITLQKGIEHGLHIIPQLRSRFTLQLSMATKSYSLTKARDLLISLVERTKYCIETSETLKRRLTFVKLNDADARNAGDLWRLVGDFFTSCGNLFLSVREARDHKVVDNEITQSLRLLRNYTGDATTLISRSPWNPLMNEVLLPLSRTPSRAPSQFSSRAPSAVPSRAPTPIQVNYSPHIPSTSQMPTPVPTQNGFQHPTHRRTNGSNSSVTSGSSYSTTIPATPLLAALGPAAQATVPSPQYPIPMTPGTGSLGGLFEGNFFQRADTLLNTMPPQASMSSRRGMGGA